MEFGIDQLRTGLRPGSSRLELSRHVEIARTCSNLVEAKFHYTILVADVVADLQRAGIWPTTYYLARKQRASRYATSLGPVCEQDSLIEFDFKQTPSVNGTVVAVKTVAHGCTMCECFFCVRWRRTVESVAGHASNSRPADAVHQLFFLCARIQCSQ